MEWTILSSNNVESAKMDEFCFDSMLYGCEALVSAPALPATMLAESCYQGMFFNCKALTSVPDLPATTLADGSYSSMFRNCSLLKFNENQSDEYKNKIEIGTCTSGSAVSDMIAGTGGLFTDDPEQRRPLWTSNEIVNQNN